MIEIDLFGTVTTTAPVATPAPAKTPAPRVEQLALIEATPQKRGARKGTRVLYTEPELF